MGTELTSSPLHKKIPNQLPRFNTLSEWLAWQQILHFSSIDLGLDRCKHVAHQMNLLSPDFKVITVAGTNGKGSSARMLETILTGAGFHVGCFTSPHLIRYNERIRVDSVEIGDDEICGAFDRIDCAREEVSLTYFEFSALAALDIFKRQGVDLAILEVGLGGRLDAVNMLDADVVLLCSIAMDHEAWLGNDRESIGFEKAGVFRTRKPVVCTDIDLPDSVIEHALTVAAPLFLDGEDFSIEVSNDSWQWHADDLCLKNLPVPDPYNKRQLQNASGVMKVLQLIADEFPVQHKTIVQSLHDFQLQGRCQIISGDIPLVLDVAHNLQSAQNLVHCLQNMSGAVNTHLIIGMLGDKNHRAILEALSKVTDFWYVVGLDDERSATVQKLHEGLRELEIENGVSVCNGVDDALLLAQSHAQVGDRIVITGSFITVATALTLMSV